VPAFLDHYELSLDAVAAGDVTPMMLFPIGTFKSAKYPELPLTRELADEVIANFAGGVLGTEPVVDSSGSHDTSAPAAAWVKRVYVAPTTDGGEAAFADVQWTDVGAQKVTGREYQYNSVELGPVVDNVTGKKTDNVLRSVTLTNTPVIRLLPPILAAGDSMAEPVDVALSEIVAAEGSYQEMREALEQALRESLGDGWLADFSDNWAVFERSGAIDVGEYVQVAYAVAGGNYTFGVPNPVKRTTTYAPVSLAAIPEFIKKSMRAKWLKAHPNKTEDDVPENMKASEDPGSHAEPIAGSSEPASRPAKGEEGHPVTLADGDAAKEGSDQMKTVALKLNLSEDADEALILAEVVKLEESRDAEKARADEAVAKLAEEAKRVRAEEVDRLLSELVDGAHILPGQKEAWAKLAEDAPESFSVFAENAKKTKAIELGETGSGAKRDDAADDASAELAEKAKARAAKDGITITAAQTLTLTEDKDLAERVHHERYGREA
jgi:hypothetical protein